MFFWLWKLRVMKQGLDQRPNLKSIKLLTRDAKFRQTTEKTLCLSSLSQASLSNLGDLSARRRSALVYAKCHLVAKPTLSST